SPENPAAGKRWCCRDRAQNPVRSGRALRRPEGVPVTVHLGDVSEAAITQFIADRKKAGHAASSINHSLQILKQASRPVVTGPQDIGALRSRTGNPRENGKDGFIWCARQESNLRPLASEANALSS